MTRPTTISGLLWRLAGLYRMRLLGVAVGVVALLVLCRNQDRAEVEACPFEQTWFQGDIHFSQELVFDDDGTGVWTTGGMDSDAPHMRIVFRWERDESTLTAVSGPRRRTVGYAIRPRNDICFLVFDDVFLDPGQSRHYSNYR